MYYENEGPKLAVNGTVNSHQIDDLKSCDTRNLELIAVTDEEDEGGPSPPCNQEFTTLPCEFKIT